MVADARRSWGKVRKLPSKRYQASYVGPDLQRHTAPTTFEDKDAATGWLRREKRLIDDDEWTPPAARRATQALKGQTFREYSTAWLDRRRTRGGQPLKDRTRAHYRDLLDTRILPTFGDTPLRHITSDDVERWHDDLMHDQTPTYTAHAYGLLHAIMASAAKRDGNGRALIELNPCQIDGAQRAEPVHQVTPATVAELQTIIDNMAPQYRLAVALMGWCALRFGETIALERGDIDTARRRVTVRKGVVRVDGKQQLDSPKSRRSRIVNYPPHLDTLVRQHLDDYAEPGRTGRLFANRTGGYLSQSTLNGKPARLRRIKGRMVNESATGFRKACEAAGRPDLRIHDLRHTGAVMAAQTGATLAELMARLGHSTPTAAMRYQHAAQDRDAVIAEKLSLMAQVERVAP